MYEVVIRKPLKHPETAEGFVEMKRSVNHELHALNLAERIVRMDRVPWVEVKEVNGRFEVRASLEMDGKVHGALRSRRYNIRRKRPLEAPWMRWVTTLSLVCLSASGISWYAASREPKSDDLRFLAELMTFATAVLAAIWAYTHDRQRARRNFRGDRQQEFEGEYTLTGRKIR